MTLLVTSQITHSVLEYDGTTGAFIRVAASGGALGDPLAVLIGLDGNLLVSDAQTNQVKRYDRGTGAFIDVFASTNLAGPKGMTMHDGALYVVNASGPPQGVQRFDAVTGANPGQFFPFTPFPNPQDVKVNPASNRLYVLYTTNATVETFDLTTMASFGPLFPAQSGGLTIAFAMAFGPDGNLYICGGSGLNPTGVRRYNPTTGAFIDLFVNMGYDHPLGIAFGPDNNLYVATTTIIGGQSAVMRFNYPTGASMGVFVPPGSGGLAGPSHLTFTAVPGATLTYTLHRDCLHNVE